MFCQIITRFGVGPYHLKNIETKRDVIISQNKFYKISLAKLGEKTYKTSLLNNFQVHEIQHDINKKLKIIGTTFHNIFVISNDE